MCLTEQVSLDHVAADPLALSVSVRIRFHAVPRASILDVWADRYGVNAMLAIEPRVDMPTQNGCNFDSVLHWSRTRITSGEIWIVETARFYLTVFDRRRAGGA